MRGGGGIALGHEPALTHVSAGVNFYCKVNCIMSLPGVNCIMSLQGVNCIMSLPGVNCIMSLPGVNCIMSQDIMYGC